MVTYSSLLRCNFIPTATDPFAAKKLLLDWPLLLLPVVDLSTKFSLVVHPMLHCCSIAGSTAGSNRSMPITGPCFHLPSAGPHLVRSRPNVAGSTVQHSDCSSLNHRYQHPELVHSTGSRLHNPRRCTDHGLSPDCSAITVTVDIGVQH